MKCSRCLKCLKCRDVKNNFNNSNISSNSNNSNNMIFFHSACGEQLSIKKVACEVINFMRAEPGYHYNVVIGTDSENHTATDFITAIVVHRVGRGGRYFWRRFEKDKISALRQRIYEEVLLSLETAKTFIEFLKKENDIDFSFEIHVDIGSIGPTKTMIQEVIGMVRGFGFDVKIKPEAYAASSVADRHL